VVFEDESLPKSVPVDERTKEILLTVLTKYRKELAESVRARTGLETGSITSAEIKQVAKFSGAGGETFIVGCSFQTTAAGQIEGGIVLKYAKDLDSEVENANALNKLLEKRQKEFEKSGIELPESMNWFPRRVFAPKVLGIYPDASCLILEFLGDIVPLEDSPLKRFEDRFRILGYALGRFHGTRLLKVKSKHYDPLFRAIKGLVSAESLDQWRSDLDGSPGGAEFIHGDSHLQNIMFGPGRLALIDAILVPGLEWMDDLGYAISHFVQEKLALAENELQLKNAAKPLMDRLLTAIVPKMFSSYSAAIGNMKIYDNLPIDFFLGAHLIVRSLLYDGHLSEGLKSLGVHFVEERPFCSLTGS